NLKLKLMLELLKFLTEKPSQKQLKQKVNLSVNQEVKVNMVTYGLSSLNLKKEKASNLKMQLLGELFRANTFKLIKMVMYIHWRVELCLVIYYSNFILYF